jgi:hypothetical protein
MPVLSRVFLLLLLACDWAADPYQGTSSLSQIFGSTETFCHSLPHRAVLAQACEQDRTPCSYFPGTTPAVGSLALSCCSLPQQGIPPPRGPSLVYLFMSLQR